MPQSHQDQLARGVTNPVTEKACTLCGHTLPSADFHRNLARTDGLNSWCRGCISMAARARRYGLTIPQVRAILASWDGRCQICENHIPRPCFDHDHETGKFRGLLCWRCNTGIPILEDSELLAKAQEYLR